MPSRRFAGGPAFTYFIEAQTDPPLIKIGSTGDVAKRFAVLSTQNAVPLKLLGYFHGNTSDEIALHELFREHRSHGEWFHAAPELRAIAESFAGALDGDVHESDGDIAYSVAYRRRWHQQNDSNRRSAAKKRAEQPFAVERQRPFRR